MMSNQIVTLLKYNIRILFRPGYIVGIMLYCLIPFLFSMERLVQDELFAISEQIFILPGIFLMAGIMTVEKDVNIQEITSQMQVKSIHVYMIRYVVTGMIIICGIVGLFIYSSLMGSEYPMFQGVFSAIAGSMFIGTLALAMTLIFQKVSVSYLAVVAYYFFEYSTQGHYTGSFYLFSLLTDQWLNKMNLVVLTLVLNLFIYVYLHIKLNHTIKMKIG